VSATVNTAVVVGSDVTFFCLVRGSNNPTASWLRPDGSSVSSSFNTINDTFSNFTLDLSQVTLTYTGTYTCTTSNMLSGLPPGSDNSSIFLYVESEEREMILLV